MRLTDNRLSLSGRTILVCEDLMPIGVHLAECLSEAGAKVMGPFDSWKEASAAVRAQQIDVALLDVQLLDGSVYPFAEELKAAGVPIVFLTGYEPADLPPTLTGAHYHTKPFREAELIEQVVVACAPEALQKCG